MAFQAPTFWTFFFRGLGPSFWTSGFLIGKVPSSLENFSAPQKRRRFFRPWFLPSVDGSDFWLCNQLRVLVVAYSHYLYIFFCTVFFFVPLSLEGFCGWSTSYSTFKPKKICFSQIHITDSVKMFNYWLLIVRELTQEFGMMYFPSY